MISFYICARFGRQEEAREIAEILMDEGHTITSTWIYQEEAEMYEQSPDRDRVLNEAAHTDLYEVLEADAILYLSEEPTNEWGRGGRHVEFGIAIGTQKQLFVLGDKENLFHYLDGILFVATVTDLIEYLREETGGSLI